MLREYSKSRLLTPYRTTLWLGEANQQANIQSKVGTDYSFKAIPSIIIDTTQMKTGNVAKKCGIVTSSKLKIRAWRATLNYLPTLSNLCIKRLANDAVCPRCQQGVENMDHVFRECATSRETWNSLKYDWPERIANLKFMEWFTWIMLSSSTDICRSFLCTIWVI
ncbi:hypothetical protein PVK06_019275 [Gossypium arboreum]|uniref:Reverse transcriptase zinc-binding domain-containing protein n=1 Tax=Gossypium arboreum TaxID=29729 RepID=A0ABR0PJK3_GOSAR|nr:hypothetical protein PVK06_019275 [Gossypium arboreum]